MKNCKTCGNGFKPKINHPKYVYCSAKCRNNNPELDLIKKAYKKQWKKDNPERVLASSRRMNVKLAKRRKEDPIWKEEINEKNRERLAIRRESEPGLREKAAENSRKFYAAFYKKNGKHYNTIKQQLQKKNNPEKYEAWQQKSKEGKKRKEAENPELYKLKQSLSSKSYYYANRENVKKRIAEYRKNLPEGVTAEWQRQWRINNPEKHLAKKQRYLERHPGIMAMHCANYRAQKIKATPKWLTEEHYRQIAEIYATCPKDNDVDHVVPLQGKTICGLHVPWNLEYMEKLDNISKGNRLGKKFEQQLKKSNQRWGFSNGGLVS
tara:strand:+ start:64 stop:1029 length:966 start_codon:yes stop_codon:yes gene_type:complete